jgi:hypothetical protein
MLGSNNLEVGHTKLKAAVEESKKLPALMGSMKPTIRKPLEALAGVFIRGRKHRSFSSLERLCLAMPHDYLYSSAVLTFQLVLFGNRFPASLAWLL